MNSGVRHFDAARLNRDAECAGQAFGFEDVEASVGVTTSASVWMAWCTGIAAVMVSLGYAFL